MNPNYFNTDRRLRVQTTSRQVIKSTRINCCPLYNLGDKHALLHCNQPSLWLELALHISQFLTQSSCQSFIYLFFKLPLLQMLTMQQNLLAAPQGSWQYPCSTDKTQSHGRVKALALPTK